MWILFTVPCPTPDGRTARDLYDRRVTWISDEMAASARELGCTFHRAWYAKDGSAFYAVACWESREAASRFFEQWSIDAEPGEVGIELVGDVGLVPLG
jgi:hypothetical protein